MVDEVLHAVDVTGKTAHAVINRDDIRFQLVDEIVQCVQRGNHAAGRHFNIGAERTQPAFRVTLRVGMDADMAFIQVSNHHFRQRARMFRFVDKLRIDRLFADQYGHAGALGFIILSGNIQDVGADNGTGF